MIKLGTRKSPLAMIQTEIVKKEIERLKGPRSVEIIPFDTKGDRILDKPLPLIGGKGLFTAEIEEALLNKTIDGAVHSLKDLPTELPESLELSAFLKRENPRDAYISKTGTPIHSLPKGAVIATGSVRRKALLLSMRPDLTVVNIRGNVGTRLKRFKEEGYDGMILALAGLKRLGLMEVVTEILPEDSFMPPPSQGVIVVESVKGDSLLSLVNHYETMGAALAERAFLNELNGGCQVPIGTFSKIIQDEILLSGMVLSLDGQKRIEASIRGPLSDSGSVGRELAQRLLSQGAYNLLKRS